MNLKYLSSLLVCLLVAFSSFACDSHDCDECRANFVSTKGSSGRWKEPDFPKTGWICKSVTDLYAPTQSCGMCMRETVRYTHEMVHPQIKGALHVGCICAGHMEGDILASKDREKYVRNRSQKRSSWVQREWKKSKKGNPYLKTRRVGKEKAHIVTIYKSKYGQFSFNIDGVNEKNPWFRTEDQAKLGAFDKLYPASQKF